MTIAYWDTEGGSRPPRLLGEYQGTPTIRLFKPKKKQRNPKTHSEKLVLDYQHGERNVKDLTKFLEYQIPNYVERVKFGMDDYHKLQRKAAKYGLPIAVVFTSKATTSTNIKWLSTEFRRRLLLVEVPPVAKNQHVHDELILGSRTTTLPALYIIPPSPGEATEAEATIIKYDGKDFKRRNLQDFLQKHALSEPVFAPIVVVEPNATTTATTTDNDEETPPEKKKTPSGAEL